MDNVKKTSTIKYEKVADSKGANCGCSGSSCCKVVTSTKRPDSTIKSSTVTKKSVASNAKPSTTSKSTSSTSSKPSSQSSKTTQTTKSSSSSSATKKNPAPALQKMGKDIGKGIKNTFMEMSESLAGWIDDTSMQFNSEVKKSKQRSTTNRSEEQNAKQNQMQNKKS